MFGHAKGWDSLVSCMLATTCMSFALVAPCLADEFQTPLDSDAVSGLQWKECGQANNHTLQCNSAHVSFWHIMS